MQNKKVAIIVSTYNGEKYIKEQIDSLLDQTYPNIDIYVRDDGSKDNSVQILQEYEKDGKIKLICGQNVGLVQSFYDCLKIAFDNADYFSYCDQDDKWHNDKIEKAIIKLEENQESLEKPILYFTEFNYCDDKLNFAETSKMNKKGTSFRNSLMECIASGNTMVFNKKIANEVLKSNTRFSMFT